MKIIYINYSTHDLSCARSDDRYVTQWTADKTVLIIYGTQAPLIDARYMELMITFGQQTQYVALFE